MSWNGEVSVNREQNVQELSKETLQYQEVRGWDVAQLQSFYFAFAKPWVPPPAQKQKEVRRQEGTGMKTEKQMPEGWRKTGASTTGRQIKCVLWEKMMQWEVTSSDAADRPKGVRRGK